MDIKYPRRTDYTSYFKPRPGRSAHRAEAAVQAAQPETMTISIRVRLPDYSTWRAYAFIRQYPYLSLAAVTASFLLIILTSDVLSWAWQLVHKSIMRG